MMTQWKVCSKGSKGVRVTDRTVDVAMVRLVAHWCFES